VSLPDELWQALNLKPEVITDRARFYAAYAELSEPGPTIRDLIRLGSGGQHPSDGEPVVDLLNPDDSEARSMRESIEASGHDEQLEPWARTGELATTWLERAMAELMTNTAQGRESLLQAAHLYQQLGLPFGSFLISALTEAQELAAEAVGRLAVLLAGEPRYRLPDEGLIGWQYASRSATQQVSLLLTATSHPRVVEQNAGIIDAWGDAPQASGITPVGTTSQPIAIWWAAGLGLADLHRKDPDARTWVRRMVISLAQAHGRQLRDAQLDSYHWSRGQTRVDLIDLQLAGLVAMTDRALRASEREAWNLEELQESLPPLARVSFTVGLDLARY
jgi:hypothetical protein